MDLTMIGRLARRFVWLSLVAAIVNIVTFWGTDRYVTLTGAGFAFMLYYANFVRKRACNELASWMGNVILPNDTRLDRFLPWLGAALLVVLFVFPHYWYWTAKG